jgi:hypothetical protein
VEAVMEEAELGEVSKLDGTKSYLERLLLVGHVFGFGSSSRRIQSYLLWWWRQRRKWWFHGIYGVWA